MAEAHVTYDGNIARLMCGMCKWTAHRRLMYIIPSMSPDVHLHNHREDVLCTNEHGSCYALQRLAGTSAPSRNIATNLWPMRLFWTGPQEGVTAFVLS